MYGLCGTYKHVTSTLLSRIEKHQIPSHHHTLVIKLDIRSIKANTSCPNSIDRPEVS